MKTTIRRGSFSSRMPKLRHSYVFAALLVTFASLLAFTYYWYTIRTNVNRDLITTFDAHVMEVEFAISRRLETYENILKGGVGLFNASTQVDRDEWRDFVGGFDIPLRYPGALGIGFADHLTQQDVPQYVQFMQTQGFTNFGITPEGSREEYVPITYLEPQSETNQRAYGYDMFSESTRRDAMSRARDASDTTLSGKVELIQDMAVGNHAPGILMYVPIYLKGSELNTVEQRRAALYGYVYAPFRTGELLSEVLAHTPESQEFGVRIYDGNTARAEAVLFETTGFTSLYENGAVRSRKQLNLYNHEWLVEYAGSLDLIPLQEQNLPRAALVRGIVTSLLFGILMYFLLENRAARMNKAKTIEIEHAKDDLLSLASHQLRTPATVVKQYVGMMLHGYGGVLSEQQHSMLQKAYDSNERQLKIINQILYVARADAGQMKLHKHPVNMNELLRDAVSEHANSFRLRHQHVVVKLPDEPLVVNGDRQYLFMVVDNILSNASKYTPNDGTIRIAAKDRFGSVHIAISDTGVGIKKESIPLVFDKFTRVDNRLSDHAGGSGIGLYLAKQIINLHGGVIRVKSRGNKGSTFSIEIPKQLKADRPLRSSNNAKIERQKEET